MSTPEDQPVPKGVRRGTSGSYAPDRGMPPRPRSRNSRTAPGAQTVDAFVPFFPNGGHVPPSTGPGAQIEMTSTASGLPSGQAAPALTSPVAAKTGTFVEPSEDHIDNEDFVDRASVEDPQKKWDDLTSWVELSITVADYFAVHQELEKIQSMSDFSLHQEIEKIQSTSDFTAKRQPSSREPRPFWSFDLDDDSDAESEVPNADDSDYTPSDADCDGAFGSDDEVLHVRTRAVPAIVVAGTGRRSLAKAPAWKLDPKLQASMEKGIPASQDLESDVPLERVSPPSSKAAGKRARKRARRATSPSVSEDGAVMPGGEASAMPHRVTRSSTAKAKLAQAEPDRPQTKKASTVTKRPAVKGPGPASSTKPTAKHKDARCKTTIGKWIKSLPDESTMPASAATAASASSRNSLTEGIIYDTCYLPPSVLPVREPVRFPARPFTIPPGTLALLWDPAASSNSSDRRGKGKAKVPRKLQDSETKAKLREKDKKRKKKQQAVKAASQMAQVVARAHTPDEVEMRKLYGPNARRVLARMTTIKSDVQLTDLLSGHSFFVGPSQYRPKQVAPSSIVSGPKRVPLHPQCNKLVRDKVRDEGYTYVVNDDTKVQACFDKTGKMFALKAMQPSGNWYREAIAEVTKLAHKLRQELRLASTSPNSGRNSRGNFSRFTFGTSFGGGQKQPTQISPDWNSHNEQLIIAFLTNPTVRTVLKHVEGVIFLFYPRLAQKYCELQSKIKVPDVLRDLGINLPFAAHTFNLGPYVQCWFHRDARNFILGICPVLVLGDFNHKTSGHFIMVEPKIIMELRPGDLLIMMSAILTHGNAPLRSGETRLSWTFFTAGGLFRWVAAGGRLVRELSEEAFKTYQATAARMVAEAWDCIPTEDDLWQFWSKKTT